MYMTDDSELRRALCLALEDPTVFPTSAWTEKFLFLEGLLVSCLGSEILILEISTGLRGLAGCGDGARDLLSLVSTLAQPDSGFISVQAHDQ